MRARTRRQWFGVSLLLLVTAVAILCFCLWQTFQLRSQISTTTDFTLTLTRLAQLNADVNSGAAPIEDFSADKAARLVAAGDVQSRELQQLVVRDTTGLLKEQGAELVASWGQVRRAFSGLNLSSQSLAPADKTAADNAKSVEIVGLQPALQSYEPLFAAIVGESLSRPLLSVASEIRGELTGLKILSSGPWSGDETSQLVANLKTHVQQLEAVAQPENGPSILGYQSRLKLIDFLNSVSAIKVVASSPLPAVIAVSENPGKVLDLSDTTSASLGFAQSLLLSMEAELVESRRNVILALLLFSLCVLLSALLGWSVRRHIDVAANRKQGILTALQFDMNRLASGEYTHHSTVPKNSSQSAAVAAAFDRAAAAIAEAQQFSRHKLSQTSALAAQQHEVVELMEKRLAALVQNSAARSDEFNTQLAELQDWIGSFSSTFTEKHSVLESQVTDTASSLARLTAQLELCDGRIDRAITQVNSLRDSLGRIEDSSRQTSLKALNESIRQSGYYPQETERFVENTQRVTHQLQEAADIAAQDVDDIRTDLAACSNTLRECLAAAQESAERIGGASRVIRAASDNDHPGVGELGQLHTLVGDLATALQQASTVSKASLPEEELLFLKGHSLELQLLAAEFSEANTDQLQSEAQT